jgi:chitodextrinase
MMRTLTGIKIVRGQLARMLSLLMAATLMVALLPIPGALSVVQQPTVAKAAAAGSVKLGDYIRFGKYNNAPILWRVINIDANSNAILFADRILTLKAFDAKGSYHYWLDRRSYGSNFYHDSNLRQWLNSSSPNDGSNKIDWIQNDPNSDNLTNNYYNNEKGFLADGNFSALERSLIIPITHKVLLASTDSSIKSGGNKKHMWFGSLDDITNYDTDAYYHYVSDNVFLLSVKELKKFVYDRGWNIETRPTEEAVNQSDFKHFNINSYTNYFYWLNTPSEEGSCFVGACFVRAVASSSGAGSYMASSYDVGVRPALQLNLSTISLASGGSGASSSPYVVSGTLDTEAPTAPTNLTSSNIDSTGITLTWTASTDNIGVTAYEVYRDSTLITTITGSAGSAPPTTYNVTGLTSGTKYTFSVRAKDAAGNTSPSALLDVTPSNIKIGDYIQFGKYNNAPILWRVIHKDANGDPILFSDRILTLKAFDTKGSYHSGAIGRDIYGSNYYKDSNIRQWLNSSGNVIDWIQNDPTAENNWGGYNSYNTEKGFLAEGNFTSIERSLIKPYTHKVLISSYDQVVKDGGLTNHIYNSDLSNVIQNYDTTAYFQNITDTIFFLSVKQLKDWVYDNQSILGTNYHIARPTTEAVMQSSFKSVSINSGFDWNYWLNSSYTDNHTVRAVFSLGTVTIRTAYLSDTGVRPALQLNLSSAVFRTEGAGTSNNPYVVSGGSSVPADTTAPTAPSNLGASIVSTTGLTLAWTASTDNVGVTAYDVYRGTTLIGTVTGSGGSAPATTYNVTGLTAGTSYTFTVKAKDTAGNVSESSNPLTVSTLNAPTAIQLSNNRIGENVWVDFEIGTLTATDADEGETFTYSLVSGEGDTDNANLTIDGDTLKAAIVFDYVEQPLHNIRVRVTDSGGATFEQMFEIEVGQSNATLDRTNKIATIFFDDPIFDNSSAIVATPKKTLKDLITFTSNANAEGGGTYNPLGADDTVVIKKDKIVITFENQISGNYNRIKVAAEALKDRFGYKSAEQITTPLVVDGTGPALVKTTMDKKKRKITLRMSERIYAATAGTKPAEIATSLKAAFTIKRGDAAYTALSARDKVTISGRFIEVNLSQALTTNDNKIQIAADALKDFLGNKSALIETPEIEDGSGPVLNKVTRSADNKTITIAFDEEAFNTAVGTKVQKLEALKNAITFAADGTTFNALGTTDTADISQGLLTIKLATALSGANNKFKIAAGTVRDLFLNTNGELTTSAIAADSVGPACKNTDADDASICTSIDLPSKKLNRQLIIHLNENILNGFSSGNNNADRTSLKAAITIKTDGGNFAALANADMVKIIRNQLQINFGAALAKDKTYQVKINADALKDLTGNKNAQIVTDVFAIDTAGPKLR